jgi:MFS family permease
LAGGAAPVIQALPKGMRAKMRALALRTTPQGLTRRQRKNFFYVQMDALGVGFIMAIHPFLAVFLTRLGATNFQVGLISSIPGFAGLALSIAMGRFLQRRPSAVPWYSGSRALRLVVYAFMGVASLLLPKDMAIIAILALWALASVPMAMLSVAFSVVMNAVAGPKGRYALMSRRWATIGLAAGVLNLVVGQILNRVRFPLNYELSFIGFALVGATISRTFSRRLDPAPTDPSPPQASEAPLIQQVRSQAKQIWKERAFVSIAAKRSLYLMGSKLVLPLFALYYVRELGASDAWISVFQTTQRISLLLGYILWTRIRETKNSRFILLATTLMMSLYPAMTSRVRSVLVMAVISAVAGFFQAGLKLVFFDELMKTVPVEQSATFVSVEKSVQHLLSIAGPMISTSLSSTIGLSGALLLGAGMRLVGFLSFLFGKEGRRPVASAVASDVKAEGS